MSLTYRDGEEVSSESAGADEGGGDHTIRLIKLDQRPEKRVLVSYRRIENKLTHQTICPIRRATQERCGQGGNLGSGEQRGCTAPVHASPTRGAFGNLKEQRPELQELTS